MSAQSKKAIWNVQIVKRAIIDSFIKLHPRKMMRNPVMFVVEVGSVLTTLQLIRGIVAPIANVTNTDFELQITSGFGSPCSSQTSRRRWPKGAAKPRPTTCANQKQKPSPIGYLGLANGRRARTASCAKTIVVIVSAGEFIPGDGEIIEGVASVDESAITGESAPVIREAGGDRSAVTGGTRVLSDQIKVRITSNPGETFIDRMIALVEGAKRQKTPNEIALNILLAGLTIIFLLAVVTLQPFAIYSSAPQTIFVLVSLLVCLIPTTIGGLL